MLKSLLSLFLQPQCLLCDRQAEDCLCIYCQKQVKSFENKQPDQFWHGDVPRFIWGNYEGKLKQAIAALKYENHLEIGNLLGYWLGETWLKFPLSSQHKKFTVVPIPLHDKKLKERGFNQAELIAKGFCQATGYPLMSQGLIRIKNTQALFGLSPQERTKIVKNAFQVAPNLRKAKSLFPVLIVDDIYTTGNTVKEAAKTLKNAQINPFGFIALSSPKFNKN